MNARLPLALAAAAVAAVCSASPAAADDPLTAARVCEQPPPALPADDRLRTIEVAGRRVVVIVPRDYAAGARRYPVLYLLHGAFSTPESTIRGLDLLAFTAGEQVIVALPESSQVGMWADWRTDRDGSSQWQSFLLDRVVPAVDAAFRTHPRRAQRAIAGVSMGGFGSLAAAARAPDVFVAAGSFSGMIDFGRSLGTNAVAPVSPALHACFEGRLASGYDVYGGPRATESVWYAEANPIDKPRNLAGVRTWFGIGDGTPCDAGDAEVVAADPLDPLWEPDFKRLNDRLHRSLGAAGVAHRYDAYGCGVHTYRHFRRSLAAFWPVMLDAFGTRPPARFDYRSARPEFGVYDWRFRADAERAPEFLDIARAGARGLTLRGSGTTLVATPPRFAPHARVVVRGAAERAFVATAGADGRLVFEVDLGPAHRVQEGRPGAPRGRVVRRVAFSPRMSGARTGPQR